MIRGLCLGGVFTLCLASPAAAFDAVSVEGILAEEDFFRAATCGARPQGDCQHPTMIWHKPVVTLAVLPAPPDSGLILRLLLSASVDYAISRINAVGSGLTIARVSGPQADIRLALTDIPEGSVMPDRPGHSAPGVMGVGYTSLWWTAQDGITEASILISNQIRPGDIVSVVLEEIFQATGPLFDIASPDYEGVSILSQTSNATVTIAGQDARLLRWLYPPEP